MSDSPLRVIAHVRSKVDCVEQVRAILSAIVEPIRREQGCVSYHLLESVTHKGEFVCVEEWSHDEAEQAHFSPPHILSALQQLPGLLAAEPDICRYRVVK